MAICSRTRKRVTDERRNVIVGLDVALKGPFPLVGESEMARESEMACFGVFHLLEIYITK
jgi:hypothetical protein